MLIMEHIEDRLKRLEQEVVSLRTELNTFRTSSAVNDASTQASTSAASASGTSSPASASPGNASGTNLPVLDPFFEGEVADSKRTVFLDNLRRSEFWFNKIGIGLLLLGIAFLFKYSVDQGWLIPAARVAMGLSISGGLLAAGWVLRIRRAAFAEVLQGGGVAGLYLSGFAAFQWYELWAYPIAFAFMGAVSILALALSVGQNRQSLSLIAVAGALGTPFLLHAESGSMAALVLYAAVVVSVATAVFVRFRWWSLHWVSLLGAWGVLFAAMTMGDFRAVSSELSYLVRLFDVGLPVVAGLAYFGLMHGLVMLRASGTLPVGGSDVIASVFARFYAGGGDSLRSHGEGTGHIVTSLTLIGFASGVILANVTDLPRWDMGWIWLAIAAFMLVGAALTPWRKAHLIPAILLFNLGALVLLSEDQSYAFLAVEMALLFMMPAVQGHPGARLASHVLAVILLFWTFTRFVSDPLFHAGPDLTLMEWTGEEAAAPVVVTTSGALGFWLSRIFHPAAVANLVAIAAVFLTAGTSVFDRTRKYWALGGHALMLIWFFRELQQVDAGQAWVTLAWAVWAIGLLVLSIRSRDRFQLVTSGVMLLLVVVKLFVIDLAQLETIWRITLFMGFGVLFLVLSYRLQSIWERE
jgi:uncharacterized membrane protein